MEQLQKNQTCKIEQYKPIKHTIWQKFSHILNKFVYAQVEELPLSILLAFFFISPACFQTLKNDTQISLAQLVYLLSNAAVWVVFFSQIAHYKKFLWWVVCIFFHIYYLAELFTYLQQDSRICTSIIIICLQSNPSEATEFIGSPSAISAISKALASMCIITIIFTTAQYSWNKLIIKKDLHKKLITNIGSILLLTTIICSIASCIYLWNNKIDQYWKVLWNSHIISSPLLLSHTIIDITEVKSQIDLDILEYELDNINVWSKPTDDIKIVYIIGESHNKFRSSSYGYFLETEPFLNSCISDSSLIVLSDVISYSNMTIDIFKNLISLSDINDSQPFHSSPLWPAVLKKAGYKVAFYDNQSVLNNGKLDFGCNYFLSRPSINKKLYDNTNCVCYEFDGELISNYSIPSSPRSLTIYHLMGEHSNANLRYPKENEFFKIEDYAMLDATPDNIKQQMAFYDNAIRYTDKQIERIISELKNDEAIVIYVSDHGESIYDFNNTTHGRQLLTKDPQRLKTEIEVPAYIWLSKKYQEKHPEKVATLRKNAQKSIFNSDLSHTLLDLAGIQCTGFKKRLSLLSDSIARPTRYIYPGNILDYDAIHSIIDSCHTRYHNL